MTQTIIEVDIRKTLAVCGGRIRSPRDSKAMTITIEITPELERQLRQEAARIGLALDAYIVKAVQAQLTQPRHRHRRAPRLSSEEAQLLANINLGLSPTEWERYHELVARRKAETLTPDEQPELIALSDRLEEAMPSASSVLPRWRECGILP